jgi:large subunit ribosomal protein L23
MNAYILKKPVITEKSLTQANEQNAYTFEVERSANRAQIAAAVEEAFGVTVIRVNTIMRPVKNKRTGRKRLPTRKAKTKKAVVTLKEGDTIALFDLSA